MKRRMNILHLTLSLVACAIFVLSPQARATCMEGCLANGNTVLGEDALVGRPTGNGNTALGFNALSGNVRGDGNTAVGWRTLVSNTGGNHNVAVGPYSLEGGDTSNNTVLGYAIALANRGNENTAIGYGACFLNSTGTSNLAVGQGTLYGNFTGSGNVALGDYSLNQITDGSNNIAVGYSIQNITLGTSNTITIGNVANSNDTIRIGDVFVNYLATYIAGISRAPLTHGAAVAVGITADGQLGVRASSAQFKEAIKPMDKASEAIFALKPVSFRYKKELDPKGTPQFGLVAEEVAKVNPDLVVTDDQGTPYTVRYEAVNAMLLNEFLKEHRKVQDLEANAAKQQEQIEALIAGLQKVSAHLKPRKSSPQIALNDQ